MTACHRFDPARRGGGASSARPVRGDLSSGAGCCCPLLYSYVGRGGVRSPTGAGHHRPGAGRRRGVACPASSGGGRGIIGQARPVRGDLSSGAGCCCPLLYSYVGRGGGVRSPTGAASSSRHGKAAHRKRATKKEVNAARAVSTSFFASNFRAAGITRRRCCCRPRWAAGIRRGPFVPAWLSEYTPPHFPRNLSPRRSNFRQALLVSVSTL